VGLTEDQAEAQGLEIQVGEAPLAVNPQAMILDETAGIVKILAGRHGKVLGAHIVSPGAVDLIDTVLAAMHSEATAGDLQRIVARHPSLGEAIVDAALDVEKRSLHLPRW
jgi:dihydrolipoamide dehydrogenase